MIDKNTLLDPRCPNCNKKQNEWLKGKAGYTCRGCGLKFELDTDKLPKGYQSHKLLHLTSRDGGCII